MGRRIGKIVLILGALIGAGIGLFSLARAGINQLVQIQNAGLVSPNAGTVLTAVDYINLTNLSITVIPRILVLGTNNQVLDSQTLSPITILGNDFAIVGSLHAGLPSFTLVTVKWEAFDINGNLVSNTVTAQILVT